MLKICDLGTAIDRSDAATAHTEVTPYLVSRFYRAPEIILGIPYDYGVDMWSIGCTLYELYTGKILFTGDSNNQMLKAIMEIRGKLTPKLYRRGQLSPDHFDNLGHFCSVERDKILGKVRRNILFSAFPIRCCYIEHTAFSPLQHLSTRVRRNAGREPELACASCVSGHSPIAQTILPFLQRTPAARPLGLHNRVDVQWILELSASKPRPG